MRPIFIVGYMGSGKSTLGRKLAQELALDFIDTDIFIENRFRERIADMFVRIGEEAFRRRERYVIEELSGMTDCIIATGGGLPCFHDNMSLIVDSGLAVYLCATDETLAQRLEHCKRTRPTIREKSGEELLQHVRLAMQVRREHYERAQLTLSIEHIETEEQELELAKCLAQQVRTITQPEL